MFETAISQDTSKRLVISLYTTILDDLFVCRVSLGTFGVADPSMQPTETNKLVARCQATIKRVAGKLIQEKKARIASGGEGGTGMADKDLLSLLCAPQPLSCAYL